MSTQSYYELLSLSSDASVENIMGAIDERYNKWRRLVTHHDTRVVEEANRNLNLLEQIRATLTNPTQRAVYDQNLESVGGLADPEVFLQSVGATRPPAPPGREHEVSNRRVDAWICPQCQTAGAVGSMHCGKCGATVGQVCPQCETKNHLENVYCSSCGVDIQATRQEKFAAQQRQRIGAINEQIESRQWAIANLKQEKDKFWVLGDTARTYFDEFSSLTVTVMGLLVVLGFFLYNAYILFVLFSTSFTFMAYIVRIMGSLLVLFIAFNLIAKSFVSRGVAERINRMENEIGKFESQIRQIQAERLE